MGNKLQSSAGARSEHEITFARPKVLLVDLPSAPAEALRAKGYTVSEGSFGRAFRVPASDQFLPLYDIHELPFEYAEQDVLVIDLMRQPDAAERDLDKPGQGADLWWASCQHGVIDPAPLGMSLVAKDLERILVHGGVCIVFAMPEQTRKYTFAHLRGYSLEGQQLSINNWSFLPVFESGHFTALPADGTEMNVESGPLSEIIKGNLDSAFYRCTVNPGYPDDAWKTLAVNKFNKIVACARFVGSDQRGLLIVLPQFSAAGKARVLEALLGSFLPDSMPHLFPEQARHAWTALPEYEHPEVLELSLRIESVHSDAAREIAALEVRQNEVREEYGYLHSLLTATDRELVIAVKKALEELGFDEVIDVDTENQANGEAGGLKEDLRIDGNPLLLIEVKGVGGAASDNDAMQVTKHIVPRINHLKRHDVQGLSIINHWRSLPPLKRPQPVFSDEVRITAAHQRTGLMTSFTLYKLLRNKTKQGWKSDVVKPILYQTGEIEPVPSHYTYLGKIEKYWEKSGAIGIRIEEGMLRKGDRIAYILDILYEEQTVDSLQIEGQPCEQVEPGALAGVKTELPRDVLRIATKVYLVARQKTCSED